MPDDATAWSGSADDNASTMASIAAVTVTMRPPHAAGGLGLTKVPRGKLMTSGVKHPSFIGMVWSTKQRTANRTPDSACDNDALIAPLACGDVPVKSRWIDPSPGSVISTTTS